MCGRYLDNQTLDCNQIRYANTLYDKDVPFYKLAILTYLFQNETALWKKIVLPISGEKLIRFQLEFEIWILLSCRKWKYEYCS